jgi:DNA-binding FadR family transcriptional regulator
MKAMFANLTRDDFGRRSRRERAAAQRQRVYALFDEIQLAIHNGDPLQVDYLMARLAEATAQDYRSAARRDH